ncbi:MAG: 4Fe-4S binding protein [Phycisphaerales bacterium]
MTTLSGPHSGQCRPPIPLPQAAGHGGSGVIRKSTMGWKRASALVLVHALIAAHIGQWLISGLDDGRRETLAPVEPSESMWTLEQGTVNAGFVMFVVAIAATLVFGRWFCGWACHVVALQDACGWLMKKCDVHPRPWRSRLLMWFPLGLACYMFLWPTFRRLVLGPWLGERVVETVGEVERVRYFFPPSLHFLGQPAPFPHEGLRAHFMVQDFWATFPPWYVAVPYFLLCGFALVYFLGAKGFCTYGCPYGGFFGPADRLSPVRIRVSDACNQCGHCTAVCTSNVRVSDEVRDFGAVIDSGCMKCLDCVSVCPTGALSAGWGLPAILTRARVGAETLRASGRRAAARYDLRPWEEIVCAVVMVGACIGFRGTTLFDWSIPLLMAGGVGAVAAFAVHKLIRMVRDLNVRGPRVQLKVGGRVTAIGWVFALVGVVFLGMSVLAFSTQVCQGMGDSRHFATERAIFRGLDLAGANAKRAEFLSPDYQPDPALSAMAREGIVWYRRAEGVHNGGWGLHREWDETAKMAWLHLVAGEAKEAEAAFRHMLTQREPDDGSVLDVVTLMDRRGAGPVEAEAYLKAQLARRPSMHQVRVTLAGIQSFQAGQLMQPGENGQPRDPQGAAKKQDEATETLMAGVLAMPGDVAGVETLFNALLSGGRVDRVAESLPRVLKARPRAASFHAWKGAVLIFQAGGPDQASEQVKNQAAAAANEAGRLVQDDDYPTMNKISQILQWAGRGEAADLWRKRAATAARQAGVGS